MKSVKVDKALRKYSVFESHKTLILNAAIAWQRCMSYEDDAKPGKNYYEERSDMESNVFNNLFLAVESYRKSQ